MKIVNAKHRLNGDYLESVDSDQRHSETEGKTFGERKTYAQAGVAAGPHADGHRIERHVAAMDLLHAFLDKHRKPVGMLHPLSVVALKLDGAILTEGHAADLA